MQQGDLTESGGQVLADQKLTEGRQNYFLAGPVCFDSQQLAALRDYVDRFNSPAEVATAGARALTGGHYEEARRTRVCSLDPAQHAWVYDIIADCFRAANEHMRFDIVPEMNDYVQLLKYDQAEAGHFRWHADTTPSDMTRKITLLVPMNAPDEYDGGELQFNQGGVVCSVDQAPGRVYAFPSWLIHQVTPVTRGLRYSLVAWIRGPNWR